MATTCIQTATSSTGGGTSPSTLQFTTQNVTAGSLLVGVVRMSATGRTGATFSDDQGNTWTTVLIGTNINAVDTYFGYALSVIGGTKATVRFAYSGSVLNNVMAIGEYPAANASAAADRSAGNVWVSGVGTNTVTVTTGATSGETFDILVTPN